MKKLLTLSILIGACSLQASYKSDMDEFWAEQRDKLDQRCPRYDSGSSYGTIEKNPYTPGYTYRDDRGNIMKVEPKLIGKGYHVYIN